MKEQNVQDHVLGTLEAVVMAVPLKHEKDVIMREMGERKRGRGLVERTRGFDPGGAIGNAPFISAQCSA
jgi:hypothetical protein